jgi:hypothetical protein
MVCAGLALRAGGRLHAGLNGSIASMQPELVAAGATDIATRLKISRASVYRLLARR